LLIVSQPPPQQPRAQNLKVRASRHGKLPRYDATGLAGLVPRRDVPGGPRRDKGISGSSKPQIGDCCNALMIAAAVAAHNETPKNAGLG
jgi:hypothetical protein